MQSSQQTNWSIVGVICLLIFVILLIILWPYRELIGFLTVGLGVLAILVALALWVIRTVTDVRGSLNEQGLRRGRLRPNDDGHYEIPLGEDKVPMFPQRNAQHREGEIPYYQGYDHLETSKRGW